MQNRVVLHYFFIIFIFIYLLFYFIYLLFIYIYIYFIFIYFQFIIIIYYYLLFIIYFLFVQCPYNSVLRQCHSNQLIGSSISISSSSRLRCASGCVVEYRICNRVVAGSNLDQGYFAPRSTQGLPSLWGR